ncbi:MAG: copper resistance protein B [Rudaea sp.]
MRNRIVAAVLAAPLSMFAAASFAQGSNDHVPPQPPAQAMPAMSDAEMTSVMEMDDAAMIAMFKTDELETGHRDRATTTAWNLAATYGGDFDKLWLRSEGEHDAHSTDARVEALWDHAFAAFWDWQLGVRQDLGDGPGRGWAAFGVQGIAPYWFTIEATAYVGRGGEVAARLRVEYEFLLTQRLVLQPEAEINAYSRDDRARGIASGLSDAELGLRLRYEWRREIAPYLGIVRGYRHAVRVALPEATRLRGSDTRLVAGVRLWF